MSERPYSVSVANMAMTEEISLLTRDWTSVGRVVYQSAVEMAMISAVASLGLPSSLVITLLGIAWVKTSYMDDSTAYDAAYEASSGVMLTTLVMVTATVALESPPP